MKAMIFAAGLGTRLRPLTDNRPKALVEINGRTMLEMTLARLRRFGVSDVIINVFHFADMVEDYLRTNSNFGLHIEISRETTLLDTGGGLKRAAHFFRTDSGSDSANDSNQPAALDEPFLVHNVDVLSTIDLGRMVQFHIDNQALATLAVQDRKASRYLLFDDRLQLCGRRAGSGEPELVGGSEPMHALAFSGIHVISPRFLPMMTERGAFSIIASYLRVAGQGERILAYRADENYWRDLGRPENIEQAAQDLNQKVILQ
jgi:NDP-sugar pyrophosphorylase family protein